MGIFGRREETLTIDTGDISADPAVVERLPDAGEFLLRLLSFLHDESLNELAAELARVRRPDGSLPLKLGGIGIHDWKNGPLTHLALLTAKDRIITGVWASFGLNGSERRRIERTAEDIVSTHGIAAAATWAICSRPNGKLHLETLAEQLENAWRDNAGMIRNGDVIKSFQKWRR